jgi:hypothetical protein
MPTKHYLVETDKGKFMVEVDEPSTPANMQAQGGDTINGQDPNAAPGVIDRLGRMLEPLAHPTSGADMLGLLIPSAEGVAAGAAGKAGPVVEAAGRGLSRAGSALKPSSLPIAVADAVARGRVGEAATVATAPYALEAAGRAVQAGGRALQRQTPLLKFEAPAVNVERPMAAVMQAAQEAAPVAEKTAESVSPIVNVTKVPAAAEKLNLSAAETKEYLRLIKTGRPPQVAADLIKAQRAMAERLGLPDAETVRATWGTNKERILRKAPK